MLSALTQAQANPQVRAVRPRSTGIYDCGGKFVVNFLEASMKPANNAIEGWAWRTD